MFHAGGADAFVTGAVLSILTGGLDMAAVELPALSDTLADAVSPVPSLEMTELAGHEPAMPESASAHVHAIATSPLYHPAAFGLVVGAPDRLGAARSMLTVTLAEALLSALSTAVPLTT